MIELSNGHKLDFCIASGALAFDGRGWPWEFPLRWAGMIDPRAFTVVAKTVTAASRKGNLSLLHPWTCVGLLPGGGVTNAVGLTNPGVFVWATDIYPRAKKAGIHLAASVMADTIDEAEYLASYLAGLDLPFVEVNVSCPNIHAVDSYRELLQVLEALQRLDYPLILKLSFNQATNDRFIAQTEPYVVAYHAINTVPWSQRYPGKTSPVEKYAHKQPGGVSGPPIRPFALDAVKRLHAMTRRPIIGGGGIMSLEDVLAFEDAGASAFSIGTCFLTRPWRPNRIACQYRQRMQYPSPAPPVRRPPSQSDNPHYP